MNIHRGKELLNLKSHITNNFTKQDWIDLGYYLGIPEYIREHPRLLQSLYFGDDDYEGAALEILSKTINDNQETLKEIMCFAAERYPLTGTCDFKSITQHEQIKQYLNTEYVHSKIDIMQRSVNTNTDLAIGTAKELIETICKSILRKHEIEIDRNWDLPKLIKETNALLDFRSKKANKPEEAERSIKILLGGVSNIVKGITELRNSYGSGHGREADFKGLEPPFARLIVGIVPEVALFYLHINGEETELEEN